MSENEQTLLEALSWMVAQYLEQSDGSLDHLNMSAGERAITALSKFDLVADQGRNSKWTKKGKMFLGQS